MKTPLKYQFPRTRRKNGDENVFAVDNRLNGRPLHGLRVLVAAFNRRAGEADKRLPAARIRTSIERLGAPISRVSHVLV
jgi:hypothetical protein